MWISTAFAQTAAGGDGGDLFSLLMPFVLIFAIMYFLMIRPQQKRQKLHQAKLAAIKRGDTAALGGGILGIVRKVGDEGRIQVEIARGVLVEVMTQSVSDVLEDSDFKLPGASSKAAGSPRKSGKKTPATPESAPEPAEKPPTEESSATESPTTESSATESSATESSATETSGSQPEADNPSTTSSNEKPRE